MPQDQVWEGGGGLETAAAPALHGSMEGILKSTNAGKLTGEWNWKGMEGNGTEIGQRAGSVETRKGAISVVAALPNTLSYFPACPSF